MAMMIAPGFPDLDEGSPLWLWFPIAPPPYAEPALFPEPPEQNLYEEL